MKLNEQMKSASEILLGVAIGDALGVPYEFRSRARMDESPCTEMRGYGTYHQPAGTWSDDSSLTFCLAESLLDGYNLADISKNFVSWESTAYWTATNEVFDIGIRTSKAISTLEHILVTVELSELNNLKYYGVESDNGNGSLMRIIPLLFYMQDFTIDEQFEIIRDVSALTHGHIRAAMCCLIYLRFAQHLQNGHELADAYSKMRTEVQSLWSRIDFDKDEQQHFQRTIDQDISLLHRNDISSEGYVIHSLEASFWCVLNAESYSETVLKAVNLGGDTDTTAAIAGGLAAIAFGIDDVPTSWLETLARKDDIIELGKKLDEKYPWK